MRGQGSIEYLMILAMVLIVAMIAVVLLGGIPVGTQSTMDAEALTYWSNARPFSITEWGQINSTMYMSIVNIDTRRLVITSIGLGNVTRNLGSGIAFAPGAKKNISITSLTACDSVTYDSYEYNVSIVFSSTDIQGAKQVGAKMLTGRCFTT